MEKLLPPANLKRENQNVNCRMFRNMDIKAPHREPMADRQTSA